MTLALFIIGDRMDFDKLKRQVDTIANVVKSIEELDPSAVVLPNTQRSIQLDIFSCGAQSVYMILKHYKKKCTIDKVSKQLRTGYEGTSLSDIKRVLRDYGLKYRIIRRASLKDLKRAVDSDVVLGFQTIEAGLLSVSVKLRIVLVFLLGAKYIPRSICSCLSMATRSRTRMILLTIHPIGDFL